MSIADGELTSIAICWQLERKDGAGIALTSHDEPLLSEGINYMPTPGMLPASVTRSLGLEPGSGEVSGALTTEALEIGDLALGRWDGAAIRLSAVDWRQPELESVQLIGGEIGDVAVEGDGFTADLKGAAARLQEPVCPTTSAECRAQFGDKQCRVNLAGRTVTAHVLNSSDGELTLDATFDDRFVLGRLRYLSGGNCGVTTVILSVGGAEVQVRDLPRAPIEAGCKVELREGCDKRFDTCVTRFANAVNFRGEPHLPGTDLLTRYPGA